MDISLESAISRLPNGRPADPQSNSTRRVLLTGYMGAGKSTIGRALASQLGWSFLDIDDVVQQATGRSIPELFADRGEAGFRREESIALALSLIHI